MGRKKLNLIGKKFGRLTTMKIAGKNKYGSFLWLCRCCCGNEIVVLASSLKSGKTKSCGCLQKEIVSKFSRLDLIGQKFRRLKVLEFVYTKNKRAYWKCLCDCGNISIISTNDLRSSNTKSCGCLQRERTIERNKQPISDKTRQKLSEVNKGAGNPSWKGGISCEPYCDVWLDKEYKESIKQRDGYKCINPYCISKNLNDLTIHHIDYNKKSCVPENLITLCRSCNFRANKDREWHKAWYQAIMYRRYGIDV